MYHTSRGHVWNVPAIYDTLFLKLLFNNLEMIFFFIAKRKGGGRAFAVA